MKKIIALLLAAMLTVALCACGSNPIISEETAPAQLDAAAVRESYDKAVKLIEGLIDTSDMVAQDQDDGDGYLYKTWMYDDEQENVAFPKEIEFDGKTIEIGKTAVTDLAALGFEYETEETSINADTAFTFSITKDEMSCDVTVSNDTDKAVPLKDMTIVGVDAASFEYSIPFSYSGLSAASLLKDVVDTLGKPNSDIHISADDYNTQIELRYQSSEQTDGKIIDDSLTITLDYVADADLATVKQISLNHNQYDPETE